MSAPRVSARFWVQKVTKQAASKGNTTTIVELAAVTRSSSSEGYVPDGNGDWSKYTPSGRIEMAITNEVAAVLFEANIGRDVAISFDFIDHPDQ